MKMETWSFLKNFMTPDLQKDQKIGKFPPIFFFNQNDQERFELCSDQNFR